MMLPFYLYYIAIVQYFAKRDRFYMGRQIANFFETDKRLLLEQII